MTVAPTMQLFAQEAVNALLRLDPATLARLGAFHGKRIRLRLTPPSGEPLEFDVSPSEAGLMLQPAGDEEPDVLISGNPAVFTRLLFGEAAPHASAELQIRGDIELGNRFRQALTAIDIDWEEHASRVVGDIAAHELGRAARALRAWGSGALRTFGEDLSEYLREEAGVAAARERVEGFVSAVDALRADAERLEKRIERLMAATR